LTSVFAQTYGVILHAVLIVLVGWLADHYRPHLLLRIGAVVLALGAYPFFVALTAHAMNILVLMTIAAMAGAFVNGTFAFVTADLFPTRIRFSGVAVVQNISQSAFGGTAPLVATALVRNLQSPAAPALVVIACGVLTFAGSLAAVRQSGKVRVRSAAAALP
jgi:MFS family permease